MNINFNHSNLPFITLVKFLGENNHILLNDGKGNFDCVPVEKYQENVQIDNVVELKR